MDSTAAKDQRDQRPAVNTERPERGPVEELIAKRLRPLNKKVQRVRGYAAQDDAALNADQRSAVANLPVLEGAIRELEDLMRQVEEAELVAAARERELREAAEREFEARVAARVAEAQLALAGRLGGFLSLHSLLRPATAEQELTFAPLDLPPRMADAVLATDILRVARMYNDIIEGGDAAHAVLGGLASGPDEEDEEDARVHELLVLLAQPEVEVPETPAEEEPQEDPAVQVTLEAPVSAGRTTLNFLQEDELAVPAAVEAEFVVVEPVSVPGSAPVNEQAGFDWTAADGEGEDDAAAAARMQEAFSAAATPEIDATADALEAVRLDANTPASSAGEGRKRAPRKRKPHGAKKETNGSGGEQAKAAGQAGEQKQGEQKQGGQKKKENGDGGSKRQNRPRQPKKDAGAAPAAGPDEDGFQVQKPKARAAKPATRGRGGRPGNGGRQGGAGGAAKENGAGNGKPRQPQGQQKDAAGEQQQPKPKPSIYKQTQPSGPSSAPIF